MFFSFAHIFQLLLGYKYFMLFPIAVIEGPIITVIAGFLSSQHVMNLYLAYGVVVFGDMVGDYLYYAVGRYGGLGLVSKFGKYVGIKPDYIVKLEQHFIDHPKKTLIFGKFTHTFGVVVLVSAGMAKMRVSTFLLYNFLPTLLKSAILILIGYFFGQAYLQINHYLNFAVIILGILAVVIAAGFIINSKMSRKLLP